MSLWGRFRGQTTANAEPPDPPRPRLRADSVFDAASLPPQAKHIASVVDPDVLLIAVETHGKVVDPATQRPWNDQPASPLSASAFAQSVTRCQQQAVEFSAPYDAEALHWTEAGDGASRVAKQAVDDAGKIPDENFPSIGGGVTTARVTVAEHAADRALATERAQRGDNRHTQRPVSPKLIGLAAAVFGLTDLVLLWRPVLRLTFPPQTTTMLWNWCLAIVFTVMQALLIHFAVRWFQERERVSTDRRNSVLDHNHAVRTAGAPRVSADLSQIEEADRDFRHATWLLIGVAVMMGLIGAFRVAKLVREGGRPIGDATLLGAIIGLALAALVLLAGLVACRGNGLGRRLRVGERVLGEIHGRFELTKAEAAQTRDAARHYLSRATAAAVRAEEEREYVVSAYRQAMIMAGGWLGLEQLPAQSQELAVSRALPLCQQATSKRQEVERRLAEVDEWLANGHIGLDPSVTAPATHTEPRPSRLPAVMPTDDRIVSGTVRLAPQPRIPFVPVVCGTAVVVLAAYLAANAFEPDTAQVAARLGWGVESLS